MIPAELRIRAYGSAVLRRHLLALMAEVEGVRLAQDLECLHRMRVASRRLRAALPLFARSVAPRQADSWIRAVRKVTRALGEARDADVQIEQLNAYLQTIPVSPQRAGVRRLRLRMMQKRAELQNGVIKALDDLEHSDWPKKMEEKTRSRDEPLLQPAVSHYLFQLAQNAIRQNVQAMLAYSDAIHDPGQVDQLHQMRIAAKKLRYTLETFAPLYPGGLNPYLRAVKDTQEMLGNIHDADVWLSLLPQWMEDEYRRTLDYFGHAKPYLRLKPGFQGWQAESARRRQEWYTRFIGRWEQWCASGLWEQMLQAVEPPPTAALLSPIDQPEEADGQ